MEYLRRREKRIGSSDGAIEFWFYLENINIGDVALMEKDMRTRTRMRNM